MTVKLDEYILKLTFEWGVLKGIARSPLGKATFLVPFLPFVIEFLDSVVREIEFIEAIFNRGGVSAWFEENKRAL